MSSEVSSIINNAWDKFNYEKRREQEFNIDEVKKEYLKDFTNPSEKEFASKEFDKTFLEFTNTIKDYKFSNTEANQITFDIDKKSL